ncbi:MAG TPA: hypothetical protein VNX21_05725 [Candidatus Thermoplasmatota archaeon]|nr:hypothetical protein [Candidatus Thermoplasmatota archaeon]
MSPATLAAARTEMPREYGVRVANEKGRKAVLVRVPRAKPDYNYELALVALYASLDDVKDAKDVLLIGDEKTVRMEPLRLRDHIREQVREDAEAAPALRAKLPRECGWTTYTSPSNNHHRALALRLPVPSVAQADEQTMMRARAAVGGEIVNLLSQCQYVYLIADSDFARVGRRIFIDAAAPDLAEQVELRESKTANPLHLGYQTPGNSIRPDLPRG